MIRSAILIASFCFSISSCSPHRATTTTTTEVRRDDGDRAMYSDVDRETTEVRRSETRTEVHEHDDPDDGLFGIVGNIIALPFRAVGALFSAIF